MAAGIASKNAGSGMVPILGQCNGKSTVLDSGGGNGIVLALHDPSMLAKIYQTVESVPAISVLTVFWQIFINLEDVRD